VGAAFGNSGVVHLNTGTLTLDGGDGGLAGGVYNLASGTTLSFIGGSYGVRSLAGAGSVRIEGSDSPAKLYYHDGNMTIEVRNLTIAQNAYVRLKFSDGGEVTLRPNTQLRIARYHFEPDKPQEDSLIFGLLEGGLRTITGFVGKRKERSYELQTTTSTIGVRGTGLGVLSCQAGDCEGLQTVDGQVPKDGTHVDVFEGRVELANQGGTLLVAAGEFACVPSFAVAPIRVPRADAVPMPVPNFDAPPPGSGLGSGCVVR
jgi:hypothetical protein